MGKGQEESMFACMQSTKEDRQVGGHFRTRPKVLKAFGVTHSYGFHFAFKAAAGTKLLHFVAISRAGMNLMKKKEKVTTPLSIKVALQKNPVTN